VKDKVTRAGTALKKMDGDKREETPQANRLSIQNETFFGRNIKIK
jgi:hypothetical protein